MAEKPGFRDSALRAVAIIGLIAILVLGAWGIIQLVVGLPDFFGNFGVSQSPSSSTTVEQVVEQVSVTAPSVVTSDQPFSLSWTHKNGSGNYGYAISYACATGLTLAAPVPTGQMQIVPCNTPFNFTNATANIQLISVLHTQGEVSTTFTVVANRLVDGKITASSTSATVTVLPQRAVQTTQAPAPTTTTTTPAAAPTATSYTASGRTSNLSGYADLAGRILSVTPAQGGRYVAQFAIENVGTNIARAGWTFNAKLPTNPPYTFLSQPQQKMYPGDKIVYSLGFDIPPTVCTATYYCNTYDPYTNGAKIFSLTVDPSNVVSDSNKSNNFATAPFSY